MSFYSSILISSLWSELLILPKHGVGFIRSSCSLQGRAVCTAHYLDFIISFYNFVEWTSARVTRAIFLWSWNDSRQTGDGLCLMA